MTSGETPALPEGRGGSSEEATWELTLYIAGQSARSIAARINLNRICDEHIPGRYLVEVIDVLERPELARQDQILAIPTLVRRLPAPLRKVIGDLSNEEKVLRGLDLPPRLPE